jgi:anti-anti-sigma factor
MGAGTSGEGTQVGLKTTTTVEAHERVVVSLVGELDLSTVSQFLVALDDAIDAEPQIVELDLRALAFMDSSGVGAYVDAFRRARAKDVSLVIGARSPAVERVLELSGVEEALAAESGESRRDQP